MFILIFGIVSAIMSVIGIVFYFSDNQTITIVAAVISLLDFIIQVVGGKQNSLIAEIVTIIIAIIVSTIFKLSFFNTLAIFICFADLLLILIILSF